MLLVIEHKLSKVRNKISDLQSELKSKFNEQQLEEIDETYTTLLDGYKKENFIPTVFHPSSDILLAGRLESVQFIYCTKDRHFYSSFSMNEREA